ncbi:phenylacetic acid degradation operon negative regulatory protein PaaX [Parahaliea mediterranea]|uniref:Phenylacetic acid degradation operon negative regulatory protein PaaX n=1 Tax=Parahaliea mediterranea TaxID=651086 RepID=A0A939DH42_9GAMM|nr:phenylacetic acid degradation operon negative regulatory protein PaaX [Parahaliea mediterranea]MBN7797367.1 phenylacetic acid degradation operon negative regulatory protein PaaX [Parahaliea mediterranea]
MAQLKIISDLLDDFRQRRPIRGRSLIITVFGDAISQHGGSLWLGSLIHALAPFGLSDRLVRTSVYRLLQEDWLTSRQVGRRSYYSLSETGSRQYQRAARRIYAAARPRWDGQWIVVMPSFLVDEEREQLRRQLRWEGYAALASGVLGHPGGDRRALDETLQELGASDKVVVMNAHTEDAASQVALQELARDCWQIDELEARYNAFLATFRPVLAALKRARTPAPEQCFQVRTLAIHEYRRILLKDTDLPDELLPGNWAGKAARNLAANLYRATYAGAEHYLTGTMETAEGALPQADASFYDRFGGLKRA